GSRHQFGVRANSGADQVWPLPANDGRLYHHRRGAVFADQGRERAQGAFHEGSHRPATGAHAFRDLSERDPRCIGEKVTASHGPCPAQLTKLAVGMARLTASALNLARSTPEVSLARSD